MLFTGDGNLGAWKAQGDIYPDARRRRCLNHRATRVLDKLPARLEAETSAKLSEIYNAPTKSAAERVRDELVDWLRRERQVPAADTVLRDWDDFVTFYEFPSDHWIRVLRLLPIPGIGLTTAATLVAEIWDINRFTSPEHLCSWAGLTPREYSSAGHTRRGHISKQGSRWVPWVMVEAAMHGLRNAKLREWYMSIAARRGEKIAAVAVGRRLLTLAYYALRDSQGCRAFPPRSSSGRARSSLVMASAR